MLSGARYTPSKMMRCIDKVVFLPGRSQEKERKEIYEDSVFTQRVEGARTVLPGRYKSNI